MYGSTEGATQLRFQVNTGSLAVGASAYLDIAQNLSIVNRRRYRQGRLYVTKLSLVYPTAGAAGSTRLLKINSLPNVWPIRQSWKFGFDEYLDATKEEREAIKVARWFDFKHFFDKNHRDAGAAANLVAPVYDYSEALDATQEWDYTEIGNRTDGINDMSYGMLGSSSPDFLGLVDEYDVSQKADVAFPDPPGASTEIPYSDIHTQFSDLDADNLQDDNDRPPYNPEGIQFQLPEHYVALQNLNASGGTAYPIGLSTPFFIAPSGLVRLTNVGSDQVSFTLAVDCVSGSYQGVHAGRY